jgi:hypothetical protein
MTVKSFRSFDFFRSFVLCVVSVFIVVAHLVAPQNVQAANCLSRVDAPGCLHGLPADQYNALLPIMQANPTPGVRPIPVDYTTIDRYGKDVRDYLSFTGVLLDNPLPYPMAWMILSTRPSALPGKELDRTQPVLQRYTRVYLFANVKVGGWTWFLVGPGKWVRQTALARLILPARPEGVQGRWVSVDLRQQVFVAFEDDRPVFTTLISSGIRKFPTRRGLFKIWIRLETDNMNGSMGTPDEYRLPYVPYVMYFDRVISLHGAYWHSVFGYPRSHGCVNMSLTDAHWLYDWTAAAPNAGVYVWTSR